MIYIKSMNNQNNIYVQVEKSIL